MRVAAVVFILVLSASLPQSAKGLEETPGVKYEGHFYQVIHAKLPQDRIQIIARDLDGEPVGTFPALRLMLGSKLLAATNAGMFDDVRNATGTLVAERHWIHATNLDTGRGNFFRKPNGVFFVTEDGAGILESSRFAASYRWKSSRIRGATQSGPLLIANNNRHPRLRDPQDPVSKDHDVRSAVGVCSDKDVYIVIARVTFFELAEFFAKHLRCADALYLDGAYSNVDTANAPVYDRHPFAAFIAILRQ
jgi:uncharacterized protein YigE (DUF2233 family)